DSDATVGARLTDTGILQLGASYFTPAVAPALAIAHGSNQMIAFRHTGRTTDTRDWTIGTMSDGTLALVARNDAGSLTGSLVVARTGAVTTGLWQATPIAIAYGGTGQTSAGDEGQALISDGAGGTVWGEVGGGGAT